MLAVQYALVFVSVIFDTTFETSPSVVRRLSCDPRVFDTGKAERINRTTAIIDAIQEKISMHPAVSPASLA